jgi:hypothetical protein
VLFVILQFATDRLVYGQSHRCPVELKISRQYGMAMPEIPVSARNVPVFPVIEIKN